MKRRQFLKLAGGAAVAAAVPLAALPALPAPAAPIVLPPPQLPVLPPPIPDDWSDDLYGMYQEMAKKLGQASAEVMCQDVLKAYEVVMPEEMNDGLLRYEQRDGRGGGGLGWWPDRSLSWRLSGRFAGRRRAQAS